MKTRIADWSVWAAYRLVGHGFFRIHIRGREHVPTGGPALLISNHVTHLDAFLLGACVTPVIRFTIWKPFYESIFMNWALRIAKAIPISHRPREVTESMRLARIQLANRQVVCIFAEGGITRSGSLLPFKRGLERMAKGLDVPIVPVFLDGLWESPFSYAGGRFLGKWPRHLRHPVVVTFGAALPPGSTAEEVRAAVERLGPSQLKENAVQSSLLEVDPHPAESPSLQSE